MVLGSIILLCAGSRVNFFPYTVLLLEQGLSFLTSKGTGEQMCYCRILTRQACMEPSILAEIPKTSHCYKLQFCPGLPCLIHAAFFPSLATPANVSQPFDPWLALYGYFDMWSNKRVALAVSEMLGCHPATFKKKVSRSRVLSRASTSLEESRSRPHVSKIFGGRLSCV